MDAGVAILLSPDHYLLEFPATMLPVSDSPCGAFTAPAPAAAVAANEAYYQVRPQQTATKRRINGCASCIN